MKKSIKKLSDGELEVMIALWSANEPVPRSWLEEHLTHMNWNSLTVNTYLIRLTEKGIVSSQRRGKANYYIPLVSKKDYLKFENNNFLEKLYGNSVKKFMAAMFSEGKMSSTEIGELQNFLEKLKRGEEGV